MAKKLEICIELIIICSLNNLNMMKGKKNMKLLRAMIHDKNKDIVNVNRIEFHYELETDIKI